MNKNVALHFWENLCSPPAISTTYSQTGAATVKDQSNQEQVDAASIAKDNCCELGAWLYGNGMTKFGNTPEFRSVLGLHKTFHAEAGRVSELINQGKYGEADRALADTNYANATASVRSAIVALKKLVAA